MKEYGGYIELDTYHLSMLHEKAIALNSGRNALAYLIEAKKIRKLAIPYFLCDSVSNLCKRESVDFRYYHIGIDFRPEDVVLAENEWLYIVNFYGQLSQDFLMSLKIKYERVIIDNAQAYYSMPLENTDTLYTCRKFFGVADGAFLYSDSNIERVMPVDESFDRMHFLLGRYERTASEFYSEYSANNHLFADEPIKRMSKLTANLLHGIDYDFVKIRRTENYKFYHEKLKEINQLDLRVIEGAFAYPLLIENGTTVRKKLQARKVYIPMLWPNVLNEVSDEFLEFSLAENILPLPCDQRYIESDIEYIINIIIGEMNNEYQG